MSASVSDAAVNASATATVASALLAVPIYYKFIKTALTAPTARKVDIKNDNDAGGRRGRLSRRPSVLEELTSVPLVPRAMLWLQTFQGLVAWLAPKLIAGVYGTTDISPLCATLCEDFGRCCHVVFFLFIHIIRQTHIFYFSKNHSF